MQDITECTYRSIFSKSPPKPFILNCSFGKKHWQSCCSQLCWMGCCFFRAIWWPISIFLHHTPESWPHLWKLPPLSYRHSAVVSERKVRRWHATKVMYWIWASDITGGRACWAAKMRIDGAGSWPCPWPPLTDEPRCCLVRYCSLNIYIQADRRAAADACSSLFYFKALQIVVLLTFCTLLLPDCYLPLKVKHSHCSPRIHILLM